VILSRQQNLWVTLLASIFVAASLGCGTKPSASTTPGTNTATSAAALPPTANDDSVYRRELLQSALNLLNSPEQFDSENERADQIVERLNQWRRAEKAELRETNDAGQPATNEVIGEKNTEAKSAPEVASLIETLPPELQQLRVLRRLNNEAFDRTYDGLFLCEAIMLRDIANHIQPAKRDDLSIAEALFDWTVRNIQLQPQPGAEATPDELWLARHIPLESVFYGRATPLQRAWVFMLLARQAGLDVVLLAVDDPRNPDLPRPWVTALHSGDELYLFDFTYGLPIPGPNGVGVATLSQAAASDAVLRQMDTADRAYPRKAADLKKVTALIEASPGYLTPRIKDLESNLSGDDRVLLSFDPASLAEKLRKLNQIGNVKLWAFPYETLRLRLNSPDAVRRAAQLERFPFTFFAESEPSSKKSDEQKRPDRVHALRLGRYLQLRGMYGNTEEERPSKFRGAELSETMERGAKYYLLRALPNREQLQEYARMQRQGEVFAPGQPVTKEFVDGYQTVRDDAAYWLGIIWLELGANQSAAQYLGAMTLDASPDGPWTNGARFNLARAYEAMGKTEQAIKLYEADRSPQRYGSRLRAERLKAASAKTTPGKSPKTKSGK
jgi:hypothetical protein